MKKYLMEGIGAFFLTLTVIISTLTATMAPGVMPLAVGSTLMVLSFAGGQISGAHYNPAVSLALLIQGRLDRFDFPYYWLAQFAGSVLAAFIAAFLLRCSGITDIPARSNDGFCALISEFLGAFLLLFVILFVSHRQGAPSQPTSGMAAGFAQFSGMFVFGSISGGFFNPAVVSGLCIAGAVAWGDWWLYGLGGSLGAAAAVSVFRVIYNDPG